MMKSSAFERPTSLPQALDMLAQLGERAVPLAGGTDVMVAGRGGKYADKVLVDVNALTALHGIREEDGDIVLGALTTFSDIEKSLLIRQKANALALGARSAGSTQIRNRGTVGGNVCNASPAADTLPALTALNARVKLAGTEGERVLPLAEFITGAYKTQFKPGELMVEVRFKAPAPGTSSRFFKVGRRNALAISRLTVAAFMAADSTGAVSHIAIAPGAMFNRPTRLAGAEAALLGRRPSEQAVEEAMRQASDAILEVVGNRWSTPYKHPVCVNLCRRAMQQLAQEVSP